MASGLTAAGAGAGLLTAVENNIPGSQFRLGLGLGNLVGVSRVIWSCTACSHD